MNRELIKLTDSVDARILIRAANWVGDAIMTTPVVRAVRKNYPKAQITVLAKPWVIPVYENNPYIDHIMVYESNGRHKRGWGTFRLARDLQDCRFDLAILMQNAFEAGLIAFLGKVKERLGYNTDARGFLLNRSIKMDPALKKKHLIEYYIGILHGAGLKDDGRHMDLFWAQPDQQFAQNLLRQNRLDPSRPVIGINPGATGGTAKQWFPERYAQLCKQLARQHQTRILIFGGPADVRLGDYISDLSDGCCIHIAGKTSLGQAFALIKKCDLFVTNDSGLMHAAAALNVNQVAVIGSTDHIATCAASERAVMVRVPVHCSPCLKDVCPADHECMDRISVDMVMETCKSLLNQNYGKPEQ
ncbi:MAG: lipopolysaccharide heptosyltransferase II [Pseudomonadota bacterium]